MNILFKNILIIILVICVYTGCRQPSDSLDGGGNGNGSGSGTHNFILIKPNRQLYSLNSIYENTFNRETDFVVYYADNGPLQKLDPLDSNLKIELVSTIGLIGAEINEEISSIFSFAIPGRYKIIGSYQNKTDEYQIEVQGNYSDPGDGSDLAGIKWLE